jgi:hypothetical protein
MRRTLWLPVALLTLLVPACDDVRKQECDKLLTAMKPLDQGTPSADMVDAVSKQIDAMTFQNQPLGVYAKNYKATLGVLSTTLKLQAGGSAPDGTADVIKLKLKEARTDREDVQRLCAQ